jgi:hypothetical protein
MKCGLRQPIVAVVLTAVLLGTVAPVTASKDPVTRTPPAVWCATRPANEELAGWRAAIERGEIPDPATRPIPVIPESVWRYRTSGPRSLTTDDIYLFEDTDELLLTDFTVEQIKNLMASAVNDLMSVHGDIYDYAGFWLNFDPHHTIGGAFFWSIENDVSGIGRELFDYRPDYGIAGENIEGMLMMHNVNTYWFDPPGGPYSDFTQQGISHEFEHRWAMHLPPLADGRNLQGDADPYVGGPCGKTMHWSYRVDGQGSAMEIREWIGSRPARLQGGIFTFNTDIPGGVFSYPDLYLMGYVSPLEMDAGASELRYMMQTTTCADWYQGPITHWTSADIIETAGPRIPDSQSSQWDWHTGWIMIYLPGDPPDQAELEKAAAILEEHQNIWSLSTLGRGTMDHSLFDETTDVAGPVSGRSGPTRVALARPSPNPLVSETTLRYTLSAPAPVALSIHDVTGRRVATLVESCWPAGSHSAVWNGCDESGARVASGVYFAHLLAGDAVRTRKLLVVR